jgi:hypothetical protein
MFGLPVPLNFQQCVKIILCNFNPLNAELNPICHLLILLGDLTFMGPCIVSISNEMQRYTVYLYLGTALHVSGGTSTHHQELIQIVSTASGICHNTVTAICRYRVRVEQFPDINKLCDVASCWIYEYIGILLGAHPILHISRIKVNSTCLLSNPQLCPQLGVCNAKNNGSVDICVGVRYIIVFVE